MALSNDDLLFMRKYGVNLIAQGFVERFDPVLKMKAYFYPDLLIDQCLKDAFQVLIIHQDVNVRILAHTLISRSSPHDVVFAETHSEALTMKCENDAAGAIRDFFPLGDFFDATQYLFQILQKYLSK